jgi:beta-1,4-mannosyl-glycoprotein beta-1,4-N-acetylglucosaminyltransferase
MRLLTRWQLHFAFYLFLLIVGIPLFQHLFPARTPVSRLNSGQVPMDRKIFDCFLYHNEAYMLYLHLLTLTPVVDRFIIGHSNQSFTGQRGSAMSLDPFEQEMRAYLKRVLFLYIDFNRLPMSESRYRNESAWRREATARNHLIEGVKHFDPSPEDLVLLCDVDEIATRSAIRLIRRRPPVHYYNLQGILYHYSFRWQVGEWERPLVIRFGSICAPLDDYKFMPFLFPLPGILHHHCSFCFPDLRGVLQKLRSFSHTEYSNGRFRDANYVWARIACGYGVLPPRWKMPEKLTLVDLDSRDVFVPNDVRFDFLRYRIGFRDLGEYKLNLTRVKMYMPKDCTLKLWKSGDAGTLM